MPQDLFHYDKMVERALRGVIHDVLARVAQEGLRSAHHFYIGFATAAPGVVVPPRLLERFPTEITIVLQHQFWDLDVGDEAFSVSLSFDKQVERLTVPFAAVRSFADPSVEFALAFAEPPAPANEPALPAVVADKPDPKAEKEKPAGEEKVVALDAFRKR
ncbi:MAG TPA: ClpXP protease specificity-enhancing factor SspB [Stellaceae bacterium]|nr:ClpXP protease specificity-enhancing factor SspB [Stellaceae bacterium]